MRDIRDRRVTASLPAVAINGMTVQVEAQIQYRAGDGTWPEHISDPEIRYSFRIPNTDLWKSGNITTGRGLDRIRHAERSPSFPTMPNIATASPRPSDGRSSN